MTMLRGLGYSFLTARDGPGALDVLRRQEQVDLLFSDVVMPHGMSGAELARRARALRPGLPVLLTSGFTARAISEEHGLADGFPVLPKPYRVAELAHALSGALARDEAPAGTNARSPRVLVVEDDVFVRLAAVTLLGECGFDVVGDAANSEAALARLAELQAAASEPADRAGNRLRARGGERRRWRRHPSRQALPPRRTPVGSRAAQNNERSTLTQ